jgi:hypothetical protein
MHMFSLCYDVMGFIFRRRDYHGFALIAHAADVMSPKQLRDAADYLVAVAELRESKPK